MAPENQEPFLLPFALQYINDVYGKSLNEFNTFI